LTALDRNDRVELLLAEIKAKRSSPPA